MGEWSRSRFWLSFFLYSRHERLGIPWDAPKASHIPDAIGRWLDTAGSSSCGLPESRRPMIARAVASHANDPAFVQALRLVAKEEGYHQQLRGRLVQRLTGRTPASHATSWLWPTLRNLLGLRFELSHALLANLIELELHRLVESATTDAAARAVCAQIVRDQHAHASFFAERLTMEYADFNFVRRNLRRFRLRVMFVAMLAEQVLCRRKLLRACGQSAIGFAAGCWSRFTSTLERVVPYHRDALLAALVNQRERPYEQYED